MIDLTRYSQEYRPDMWCIRHTRTERWFASFTVFAARPDDPKVLAYRAQASYLADDDTAVTSVAVYPVVDSPPWPRPIREELIGPLEGGRDHELVERRLRGMLQAVLDTATRRPKYPFKSRREPFHV